MVYFISLYFFRLFFCKLLLWEGQTNSLSLSLSLTVPFFSSLSYTWHQRRQISYLWTFAESILLPHLRCNISSHREKVRDLARRKNTLLPLLPLLNSICNENTRHMKPSLSLSLHKRKICRSHESVEANDSCGTFN